MSYKIVTLLAGSATMYDTTSDKPKCVAMLERVDMGDDDGPFWIAMSEYVFGYGMMQDRWSHSFASGRTRRECAAAAAEELGIAPNPARPPEPNYRITEWWD